MKIEVFLNRHEIDRAVLAHIVSLVLTHQLACALDDAPHSGLADEHVVRFFGQHEAAGARQRVEPALAETRQLVLAIAVGEEREHEVREPVRRALVEGAQDPGFVAIPRATLEERLRFLSTVTAEVGLEQIDHRPEAVSYTHLTLPTIYSV